MTARAAGSSAAERLRKGAVVFGRALAVLAGAMFACAKTDAARADDDAPAPRVHALGLQPSSTKPGLYRGSQAASGGPSMSTMTLPTSADNSAGLPPVGDQGRLNSCGPWSVAYYCRTYQEKREHGWSASTTNHQFSPSFIYNQVSSDDVGTTFDQNLNLLLDQGCAPLASCAYDDLDHTTWPSHDAFSAGIPYRIQSYTRLGDGRTAQVITAMKTRLAGGDLCLIGIPIWRPSFGTPGSFESLNSQNYFYDMPADADIVHPGNHALAVVGYDDSAFNNQGGFKIVNQWGAAWGNGGFAWVSYRFVQSFAFDIYVMDDRNAYQPTATARIRVSHGAWNPDSVTVTVGCGPDLQPLWSKKVIDGVATYRWSLDADIEVDVTEGAAFLPPTPTRKWWVKVTDNRVEDVATLQTFDLSYGGTTYSSSLVMPLYGSEYGSDVFAYVPAGTSPSTAYYVNDAGTAGDAYCTAAGNDANNGTSASTPKATLQAVVDAYVLKAGDTVYVDAGTYLLTSDVRLTQLDRGANGNSIRFVGAVAANGECATVFDRGANSGACFNLGNGVRFIQLENFWLKRGTNGVFYDASYAYGNDGLTMKNVRITDTSGSACNFYQALGAALDHCRVSQFQGYGVEARQSTVSLNNCSVAAPPSRQCVRVTGSSSQSGSYGYASLSNSILSASAAGGFCVFVDSNSSVTSARFNDLYAASGATIGFTPDGSNLSADPLFIDSASGELHLKSTAGRWNPAANGGAGGFVADAVDSPAIDAADFVVDFSAEPSPNGGRADLGAYGAAAFASKSPYSRRHLLLDSPAAGATIRNSRPITWRYYGSGWQSGDTLRIEYSSDGGTTWNAVPGAGAVPAAAGSFAWNVLSLTAGTNYMVRLVCNQDGAVAAATPGALTVDQPTIYYVNDGSTTNDVYCTAAGNDSNSGLSASAPKATVQAVLAAYDLEGGDVVYMDTGVYTLTSTITIGTQDGGDAADRVRIVGSTHPAGTVINRNATGDAILLSSVNYVSLENLRVKGGGDGVDINSSTFCAVTGCRLYGNFTGIAVNSSNGVAIDHNVIDGNMTRGILLQFVSTNASAITENTICRNGTREIEFGGGNATDNVTLRNNIIWADGPGSVGIYVAGYSTVPFPSSDYNDLYATGGAAVGNYSNTVASTLSAWQSATGLDAHTLSNDPLLVDRDGADNVAGDDDDDLHLQSTAGSWHGGAFTTDSADSPCIDAGDPAASVGSEPSPNGSRINLGANGGTAKASKTPSGRVLALVSPIGSEMWRGTCDVVWQATGTGWAAGNTVRLEYSGNAGATWSTISGASSLAYSAGRFTWNTSTISSGATLRVRATCNQDSAVLSASAANFTVHNTGLTYYVNDSSTTNDVYCTAAGNAANDGVSAAGPKSSVQAIVDAYDLEGGDVVYVDTGVYTLTATITVGTQDGGDAVNRVRFVGSTHPSGTIVNRNNTSDPVLRLNGDFVSLEKLRIRGGQIGVLVSSANSCSISGCRLYANLFYGVQVSASSGATIDHDVIDDNTTYGVYLYNADDAVISNNTIWGNRSSQVFLDNSVDRLSLRNNIVSADQPASVGIYVYNGNFASSDYNDISASGGGSAATYAGVARPTLSDWQVATGLDAHSLNNDPMFVDRDGANNVAGDDDDDLHLQSTAGSWHGGAFTADSADSPCIDAGDPAASVGSEPSPNGSRINLGADGGTAQASKRGSGRVLALISPNGAEMVRGNFAVVWAATGAGWTTGNTIRLEYSSDGGAIWSTISGASSLAYSAGAFTWNTNAVASGAKLVRITCNQDSTAQRTSAAGFTVHNTGLTYYVNDASTTNDVYCTAAGNAANDGLSASAPKASVQAIVDAYDLEGGDVVYVDTGAYTLTSTLTIGPQDGGDATGRVRFVGSTHPGGTIINHGPASGDAVVVSGAGYVSLENLRVKAGGAGIWVLVSNFCNLTGCRAYANSTGIVVDQCSGVAIEHCVVDGNTSGIRLQYADDAVIVGNTICGNVSRQFEANVSVDRLSLRHNIVWAAQSGGYCIYYPGGNGQIAGWDYNDLYATGGASVAFLFNTAKATLANWQSASGVDAHSLSADPLLVDRDGADNVAGNDDDDLHVQSTAGSWHGGAWTSDASDSPCIDSGDPTTSVGSEPSPSGARINLGAYGGTSQASKCYYARRLVLSSPDGGSFERLTANIRWSATGTAWQTTDLVALSYSADSGATWQTISGGGSVAASAGTFAWDLRGLAPGANYRVKLVYSSGSAVNVASNADFTVGGAYYVNDGSTTGDAYCTAVGNDSNDGLTPATPKATLQAVLNAYDLEPGDTVFVDAGTYTLAADVAVAAADGGSTTAQVRIVGVKGRTVLDRNSPSNGVVIYVSAAYVTVESLDLRNGAEGVHVSGTGSRIVGNLISGCGGYGIYDDRVSMTIEGNTVLHGGASAAIWLRALYDEGYLSLYSTVRNNTVVATGTNTPGILVNSSQGCVLRNNLICVSGSNAYGVIATPNFDSMTVDSDYNDVFASGGAKVGLFYGSYPAPTLSDWRSLTGWDLHSISADPLFANAAGGDFHLKSAAGRFDPSTASFVADSVTSLGIDSGDPASDVGLETSPNGGRVNIGADGGGAQASRSSTASRRIELLSPNGAEVWQGVRGIELTTGGAGWASGDTVRLECSANGGSTWTVIAGSVPYAQTRFWWDTVGVSDGTNYVIRATAVQDGSVADSSQAAFTVANNDVPVAVADSVSVDEDFTVVADVLANDTGLRNTPLALTIVTAPTHGQAVVNANQTITYSPSSDYNGSDSCVYRVADYDGQSSTATLSISILAVSDYTPLAADDSLTTAEDTAAATAVVNNDAGLGDLPLTVTVTSSPAHGTTIVNADKSITYTPTANYNGPDSYVYQLADRDGETSAATTSITVTAVNDAPVVAGTAGSLAYVENQAAAAIAPSLTATDVDSANLAGATASLTGNFAAGQDVLSFANQSGITGSYDAAAGVLTLTGTASVASYQTALRTVAYANSSDSPSVLTRTVTFTANDGSALNNLGSATRTITVAAVNDAPVLTASSGSLSYVENQSATGIDAGLTTSDLDSANFVVGSVAITTNFASGQDVLSFTNQSGITGVYNAGTGVLTLTGSAGVAAYQTAFRSVAYSNTSENPSALARTVTFTANDGSASNNLGSTTRTITVTPVNDAPAVGGAAGSLAYSENQAAASIVPALTASDVDGANLVGATVAVTGNFVAGEDVLSFVNQGGITGSYDSVAGVLTLTGTATIAVYQSALRTVAYSNSSDNPSALSRAVTFTANDGAASNNLGSATRTIAVTPVNDAPVLTAGGGSLAFAENQAATAVDLGLTVADVDSANFVGGSVAITSNFAAGQDVLAFTNQNGITGSFSAGTGVLTLTGSAPVAAYQTALRTVAYVNSSENPSALTRTVTFTANDGGSSNNLGSATRTITVTPVNDAPVVTTSTGSVAYVENQSATAIDGGLTTSDADSAVFTGATVTITANFLSGEDALVFANQGGITGNYDAGTGVLTLTGTATVAAYRTALRSVAYSNSSDNPTALTRTVTFIANDGGSPNNLGSATRTITVTPVNDAPVVTTTPTSLAYVENQAAPAIDGGLTVSDVDSPTFVRATVAITGNFAPGQDALSFADQGGIAGSYVAGTGVLTLTGTASVAVYQSALRNVAYANSSENPSALPRTVTFTIDDGSTTNNLASASRSITVTAVNDAPTFVLGPDQSCAQELGPQTVPGFASSISPGASDEARQNLDFIVSTDHPEIFAAPPAISSDGTLTYTPAPVGSDTAVVTVRLHDDGGTADGGKDTSDPQTFKIAVTTIAEELGTYNGLSLPAQGAAPGAEKTGLLQLVLAAKGRVKGRLKLGAFSFGFSGTADNAGVVHFGADGKAGPTTFALRRRDLPDLELRLVIDASQGTDKLAGGITLGGAPFSTIAADRALYTARAPAAPYRSVPEELLGTFTVAFAEPTAADLDAGAFPHGSGFGVVKIARSGVATLTGRLTDGTEVTCRNALSKRNEVPIWIPLAKGQGAIAGYAHFEATSAGDVSGSGFLWFRPSSNADLYPQGWPGGIAVDLVGSAYRLPPKLPPQSVLPGLGLVDADGNAELRLRGGGLEAAGLTKALNIDPANKVHALFGGPDKLTATIVRKSGLFKGVFVHPVSGRKTPFQGVILQKQAAVVGFFIGAGEVGSLAVEPKDAPSGE